MSKIQITNKMVDFKDNFSSESFYPDSNYYLDQDNNSKETPLSEDQISNMEKILNGQIVIGLLQKGLMVGLQMIGFIAVIINYTLLGWIAYPIL